MTSNIGARFIQKKASMGFQSPDTREVQKSVTDMVLGEVKKTFNPEFINRVDEIIVFDPLSDDDLRRIAGLLIDNLNQHLVDRRLKIEVTTEVVAGSSRSRAAIGRMAPGRCGGRSSGTSRIPCPRSSSAGSSRRASSRSTSTTARWPGGPPGRTKPAASWP
jgi:hypothetical protein